MRNGMVCKVSNIFILLMRVEIKLTTCAIKKHVSMHHCSPDYLQCPIVCTMACQQNDLDVVHIGNVLTS